VNLRATLVVTLALAALAPLGRGQLAAAPDSPQYPLAMHTRWTYQMRQEFGPGVHPSGPDAALVKGNVLETTVVSEVVGSDTIGGMKYSRVESRHDGRLWMTEWLRLTPDGLFLGKTNEDGQDTVLVPPEKILSPRMAAGETWTWKASGAPANVRMQVVGMETTQVPAGKFDATKTIHELNMVLPEATVRYTNSRWFSAGVGYVRQESEVYSGDRLLTRTQLRLTAFNASPSAPSAPSVALAPTPAAAPTPAGAAKSPAAQESVEQDSDLAGVKTRIVYLRQYNGALHLGVAFKNTTDKPVRGEALLFDHVTLTEPRGGQKHFPLKSGQGRFVAGPISDWNSGGRWWVNIPARGETLVWALFAPIAGSTVDVSLPVSQPFDAVRVSTDPPSGPGESGWVGGTLRATITSVTRAEGQMKVRIKLASSGTATSSDALEYQDVYALDPANKRQYALVKDADGNFLAQPVSDQGKGGRYFPNKVPARGQVFMALTFAAPPDTVKSVDIVIPQFDVFEAVPIAGEGGGGAAGAAVAGRTIGLEKALQDLHADVTPQQVKVNLSADVLFDFDKADLKPEAEPQLAELATVIKGYPGASVNIEGHSDGKGADAYNQTLSEKRAASIAQWLVAKGGASAPQLHTRGWGKTKPIAPNTKPNGADDPDGRAKNRRVEITIAKS
jgi:outer membrane protein OmpA-like peptidoglycan-associated protein